MILVTGPTGSGKTVSLYTCLNLLNKPGVNISTAEDPAEINLPGVNQVNVNDKAGLTFAAALKSFLRQDPDIIMVGEIRDLETADIAIKAAQTGHLVMSTLHTNDAPTTLTRMRNMGIAPFNIASSVILITAQRLARRLCPQCKKPMDIPYETLIDAGFKEEDVDGTWTPYRPVGCSACNNGYKGRVGIYQVMPISEDMQRIILATAARWRSPNRRSKEGVRSLRESGLTRSSWGSLPRGSAGRHERINSARRREEPPWRPQAATKEFVFEWEGRDRNGKQVRGETRAAGENQVMASLRRQGVSPTKIKKRRCAPGSKIKPKDIAIFTASSPP